MKRREFITLLGGAAGRGRLAVRAQQPERVRRIGMLVNLAMADPQGQARVAAFVQGLRELGWVEGRNVRIDYRWSAGDTERNRKYAAELVALGPDVLLGWGGTISAASRTVPIVFAQAIDPVGAGYVDSLARPGGNVTGFTQFEYGTSVKWIELLKQIAPGVTRVAVLRDPNTPSGIGQFGAMQGAATSFGVELLPLGVDSEDEIKRAVASFARNPNGGLIVTAGQRSSHHRELIAGLTTQHRLPAVYPAYFFVAAGGLISYGPDRVNPYGKPPGMLIASLRARNQPTCRCRRRPSWNW